MNGLSVGQIINVCLILARNMSTLLEATQKMAKIAKTRKIGSLFSVPSLRVRYETNHVALNTPGHVVAAFVYHKTDKYRGKLATFGHASHLSVNYCDLPTNLTVESRATPSARHDLLPVTDFNFGTEEARS